MINFRKPENTNFHQIHHNARILKVKLKIELQPKLNHTFMNKKMKETLLIFLY